MNDDFREALERLAAEAEEQARYLEQLGTAPSADELALEFSDALQAALPALPSRVAAAARRLDEFLEGMSGDEHVALWTVEALKSAPEWQTVRELAREVKVELP